MLNKVMRNIWHDKKSIISFLSVGAITSLLYLGLFTFAHSYLKLNDFYSLSIAYFLAVSFYFFANRYYTFKTNNRAGITPQITKFMVLLILNYLITLAVVNGCQRLVNLSAITGIIISIFLTTVFNYLFAKMIIFKTPSMHSFKELP